MAAPGPARRSMRGSRVSSGPTASGAPARYRPSPSRLANAMRRLAGVVDQSAERSSAGHTARPVIPRALERGQGATPVAFPTCSTPCALPRPWLARPLLLRVPAHPRHDSARRLG